MEHKKIEYKKRQICRLKSTEDFKNDYYKKHPDSTVLIIGEYTGANNRIKSQCSICEHIWEPQASGLTTGYGCPKCARKKVGNQNQKTHEEFLKKYYDDFPSSNILITGKYKGVRKKISCKCNICDYEWQTTPQKLLMGRGCENCAGCTPYTTSSFIKAFNEKYPDANILIKGEYVNNKTKIACECLLCGNNWYTRPSHLLSGHGCKECKNNERRDTIDIFIQKLNHKYPNNNIIVIGKYKAQNKPIECKCGICGYKWSDKPNHLLNGRNCPKCSIMKSEKSIGLFLDCIGVSYKMQVSFDGCKDKYKLRFDYLINDYRFEEFLLERQGEQHERPVDFAGKGEEWAKEQFKINQRHDKIKVDFCQETGRILEFIWYYEDVEEALINLLRKHIKPEYNLDEILNTTREQVA